MTSPNGAVRRSAPATRVLPGLLLVMVPMLLTPVSNAQLLNNIDLGPPTRFTASIGLYAGAVGFEDHDLSEIYGIVPALGLRAALPIRSRAEFLVGAGFLRDTGDAYHSHAGLNQAPSAVLTVVPIEVGMRFDLISDPSSRIWTGFLLEYMWVTEKLPGTYALDGSPRPQYDGRGWSFRLVAGPEWRLADGRWSLGAEFSLGGREVRIDRDGYERGVPMLGAGLRGYVATHF